MENIRNCFCGRMYRTLVVSWGLIAFILFAVESNVDTDANIRNKVRHSVQQPYVDYSINTAQADANSNVKNYQRSPNIRNILFPTNGSGNRQFNRYPSHPWKDDPSCKHFTVEVLKLLHRA